LLNKSVPLIDYDYTTLSLMIIIITIICKYMLNKYFFNTQMDPFILKTILIQYVIQYVNYVNLISRILYYIRFNRVTEGSMRGCNWHLSRELMSWDVCYVLSSFHILIMLSLFVERWRNKDKMIHGHYVCNAIATLLHYIFYIIYCSIYFVCLIKYIIQSQFFI